MYAIEFRDEEYDALIEEAKDIVRDATKMKKKACKLIKKLAYSKEDAEIDDEEMNDEEMLDEMMYREHTGMGGVNYRRGGSRGRTMYRRM